MKNKKLAFKREFSAGGVVYKEYGVGSKKYEVKWLVGKHSGYHKWVLPKGLIEKGERGFDTALREVEEEMGVRAKLISERPIHKEQYWFVAELKDRESAVSEESKKKPIRRVAVYQETPEFDKSKGKTRVFKTVSFYLMEFVSGDPKDHDWEMEEAGWYLFKEAVEKLAFKGEKEALRQAQGELNSEGE
jgi:8-oxo-dGTP pyrophosphatase MutT (NUDIX family)